jgi:RNA polymerase sigma-70 factor, ECF subfamily
MSFSKDSAQQDDGLLARARTGDRKALGSWLERHQAAIYRFARGMCRDDEVAKDVLQDSLLAAARTIDGFRGDAAPTTWLFTIARSFCLKHKRKRKDEPNAHVPFDSLEQGGRALVDPKSAPDVTAAGRELDQAISAAIDELEPGQREVLLLRDVEGLSAAEAAQVLGLSSEAVKSRLHRARSALRSRLAPMLEPPAASGPGCRDLMPIFSRHLEGDLAATDCAKMEQHLSECPRCKGACHALRRTLARCSSGLRDVPEDVRAEVRRAVERFLGLANE